MPTTSALPSPIDLICPTALAADAGSELGPGAPGKKEGA